MLKLLQKIDQRRRAANLNKEIMNTPKACRWSQRFEPETCLWFHWTWISWVYFISHKI